MTGVVSEGRPRAPRHQGVAGRAERRGGTWKVSADRDGAVCISLASQDEAREEARDRWESFPAGSGRGRGGSGGTFCKVASCVLDHVSAEQVQNVKLDKY